MKSSALKALEGARQGTDVVMFVWVSRTMNGEPGTVNPHHLITSPLITFLRTTYREPN